jgi:hypothetical protein
VDTVNGARESASRTIGSAPPEKIPIHDRTETRIFFEKLLRGVQVVVKTVFFIGCGAIAIALERLGNLTKNASDTGAGQSSHSPLREEPHGIVVPIFPIDNYNQLNPARIIESLAGLSTEQLWTVRNFETTHKNRNRIVETIDQYLAKSN